MGNILKFVVVRKRTLLCKENCYQQLRQEMT